MAFTLNVVPEDKSPATDILKSLKGKNINISSRFINDVLYLSMRQLNPDFTDTDDYDSKLLVNYFPDHATQIAELYEKDRLTKTDLHAIITAAYLAYLINTDRYISYVEGSDNPMMVIQNDAEELMNIFLRYAYIIDI